MTTHEYTPVDYLEREPFEVTPERRQELIDGAGYGIDPITNRGASAAREILAFVGGYEMRVPVSETDSVPVTIADHVNGQIAFFVDEPAHMSRFGMSEEIIEQARQQLQQL